MYFKDELTSVDYSSLEHKEWKIIESKVENKNYNVSDGESYSTVAYTFSIQRYSASEMLLIVSPALSELFRLFLRIQYTIFLLYLQF